eukprot:gene3010-3468_t
MQYVRNLKNLNPHLLCFLCGGYLIEATTLIECSHSFCKTCIVHYLETSFNCPVCDTEVHKTKPLENIRSDQTLQEIIYKIVPELYEKEKKARQLYDISRTQQEDTNIAGQSSETPPIYEDHNRILVTLRYFRGSRSKRLKFEKILNLFPTRYLCCPLNLPVRVMKKFILQKFDLPLNWDVEVWRTDETLLDHLTLSDIVRIYGIFRERKPLEISFSVTPEGEGEKEEKTIPMDTDTKQCNSMNVDFPEKESISPSTIAARNILTTTPDPSDEEDNKENNARNKQLAQTTTTTSTSDIRMDIDQDVGNSSASMTNVNNVLESPSIVPTVSVSS